MVALFVGRLGYQLVLPELCDDPTDQLLRTSVGAWCTDPARRESDIVVFYYSGHGAYSGDRAHFLMTANSKERNLEGTAVKSDQLARLMLADTPLKHLLIILDTCHAGMGTHDIARTAISLDAGGTKDFDLIAATAPKDSPSRSASSPRLPPHWTTKSTAAAASDGSTRGRSWMRSMSSGGRAACSNGPAS